MNVDANAAFTAFYGVASANLNDLQIWKIAFIVPEISKNSEH